MLQLAMPWYIFVLLSSALFGMNNLIEKYVLDKRMNNPMTLTITGCFLSGLIGLFLFMFFPNLRQIDNNQGFLLLISGALGVFYLLPYYKALKLEDASLIVPLFKFEYVFVLVFGAIFLKEYLTIKQIVGLIIIIISGLFLGCKNIRKMLKPRKSFWLMAVASLMIVLSAIAFKGVTNNYSFLTGMTYSLLGGGLMGIILLCIPENRKNIMKVNYKSLGLILLLDDAIDVIARFCSRYALTLTMVTYVYIFSSVQSFFVLIYGITLTLAFPKIIKEDISLATIINKIIVGIFMFAGMWLVYF
jgi:uncharacterized membrane protein